MEYFIQECSMVTNDERCTREIKFRNVVAKAAIKTRRLFSTANWKYISG